MNPIQTTDPSAVTIHACYPIGTIQNKDGNWWNEKVTVRRPTLTSRGTKWMNTVWDSRRVG